MKMFHVVFDWRDTFRYPGESPGRCLAFFGILFLQTFTSASRRTRVYLQFSGNKELKTLKLPKTQKLKISSNALKEKEKKKHV